MGKRVFANKSNGFATFGTQRYLLWNLKLHPKNCYGKSRKLTEGSGMAMGRSNATNVSQIINGSILKTKIYLFININNI